jgi:hypothetical protein
MNKKHRTTHQRNRKIGRKNSASHWENFLAALLLLLLHRSSSNREEQKLSKVNSESSGKQPRLGSDGKAEEGEGRKTILWLRSDDVADELTGHASWLYLQSRGPKLEPSIIPSVNLISQAARRILALPVKWHPLGW